MIPEFTKSWLLPPGIHDATWEEFCKKFGNNPTRKKILENLIEVLSILKQVGCMTIYIDGSFVSKLARPGDFDICWEEKGVDLTLLNDIAPLLRHSPRTFLGVNCRKKYGGDVFSTERQVDNPNLSDDINSPSTITFLEFFQLDKSTGKPKGIIVIDLTKTIFDNDKK